MLDITTLAAWGEFIGGIAVVVSLIYLAGQIRQNSRLLRASTASATAQYQSSGSAILSQDPELARIYFEGLTIPDDLAEGDQRRFDPIISVQMDANLQQYEFERQGIALPLMAERLMQGMRWQMQQPGMQRWWRDWSFHYPREFRDHMERLIGEGEAAE